MNQISRKSMIGAVALVASLSAPLAFAQATQTAPQPAPQTAPTPQPAPTPAAQTDTMAPTAATPAKKSWNDVDADQNGKLSKAEASSVPALGQIFDEADSDADGALTPDEYKNYVAKVQGGTAPAPGS